MKSWVKIGVKKCETTGFEQGKFWFSILDIALLAPGKRAVMVARDSCDVTHSLKQASIHTTHVHASKGCTKYSLHLVQSTSTHKFHNAVRGNVLIVGSRPVFMQDAA